jgi:hypothetical protein
MFCPICGGDDNICTCALSPLPAQVGPGHQPKPGPSEVATASVGGSEAFQTDDPGDQVEPAGWADMVGRRAKPGDVDEPDQFGGPAALLQFFRDFTSSTPIAEATVRDDAGPGQRVAGRGGGAAPIDPRFASPPSARVVDAPVPTSAAPPPDSPPAGSTPSAAVPHASLRIAPFASQPFPAPAPDDDDGDWWA